MTVIRSFPIIFAKNASTSSLESFRYVKTSNNCLLFFGYNGFICVRWPKIFIRVIYDVDFVFFRNQFVKCPFFFSTQVGTKIKFDLVSTMSLIPSLSYQRNSSISFYLSFATKWFLRRNCLFKQNVPGVVSVKYILFCNLLLKSPNFLKVCLRLASLHLGINFVPRDKTRIVAILGLNVLDRLWTPIYGNNLNSRRY